eukprot:gene18123-25479_t
MLAADVYPAFAAVNDNEVGIDIGCQHCFGDAKPFPRMTDAELEADRFAAGEFTQARNESDQFGRCGKFAVSGRRHTIFTERDAARGCDDGLYEKLDYSKIVPKADLLPAAVNECAVGIFVWSTVMAYNGDKLKTPPTSWADFWDTKKIPGKRGMRKGARYNLEFALLADGVKPADVYKVLATKDGADRAFKKLAELKPHIQWWEAGAQPPQYLASGDVVMSSAYNGRIAAVQKESNLKVVWNGGIYDFDAWAIPKGLAKDRADAAKKFIAFSVQPQQQKIYSENIAYGPANTQAVPLLAKDVLKDMPTTPENIANQVQIDVSFWADNGEQLEQRFNSWAAK